MSPRVRVLVVDDSAFARRTMTQILEADMRIDVVGYARDGIDALEKIGELAPDVVTLDLVMPELDGVGVLRELASREASPRAVVVSTAEADSDLGVAALEAGAFDVVHKPTALATDRLFELRHELVAKVIAAAEASRPRPVELPPPIVDLDGAGHPVGLVVIGASTGGPRAITELLRSLPASFPVPIAIVVHMPVGYTDVFARRLDEQSSLAVFESSDGAIVAPGAAVIARAGRHLRIVATRGRACCVEAFEPANALHRPSVDVLLSSAAEAFGEGVIAVVLTGMGNDGAEGAKRVRDAGGHVIVEAASTCVVHGMPRAVAELGLANAELPLDRIAAALVALTGSARGEISAPAGGAR